MHYKLIIIIYKITRCYFYFFLFRVVKTRMMSQLVDIMTFKKQPVKSILVLGRGHRVIVLQIVVVLASIDALINVLIHLIHLILVQV